MIPKDMADFNTNNIFNQGSEEKVVNSHKIIKQGYHLQRQPFSSSLKYNKLDKKISGLKDETNPSRKKSVQSYHQSEHPFKDYKREEEKSNSSSRTKLVPSKTP